MHNVLLLQGQQDRLVIEVTEEILDHLDLQGPQAQLVQQVPLGILDQVDQLVNLDRLVPQELQVQ
jgi:hypothetical protein